MILKLKNTFGTSLLVFILFGIPVNFAFAASQNKKAIIQKEFPLNDSIDVDSSKGAWWYGGQAKENYENRAYQDAILDFTRAIKLDPEISEFYYYRGNSLAFENKSQLALEDFKKALELNPDYLSALSNLGWEFLKKREFRAAFSYFFNYIKLIPKDPKTIFGVGLNNDFLNLLNNLGWESMRNKEFPKAIRYFNNYLKLAPQDPDAYLGLALVYYQYRDFENATLYLDNAKNLEPSLYQGFTGIAALEKTGCSYTDLDKALIKNLFAEVGNRALDLQKLTKASVWKFLFGFMYLVLGVVSFIIFLLRIKKTEGYIFYLAILNVAFGLKFLYENPLVQLTELPTPDFWLYIMPIIAAVIPIVFILFIRYFIGWGWRRSILWLLIYSILQGIIKIVTEYTAPAEDIYGTTNTIFGLLSVIVLFMHLFLPDMRKNREVQIIGAGLGFYLIAIFYANLAGFQWLPEKLSFDEPAYLFFNICLIYVALRRITNTEKEFYAVKQDLETARNIQNGILPELNPKSEKYELAAAYVPMALIGGDYFDYQIPDENHIRVLIADVSGHGISAALIASMVKVAFTSQESNAHKPALVLQQINRSLAGQLNNEFITAGYFGIDLNKLKLTYSSAGHPPLVFYRRANNEIKEIKVPGIPIGVFPETTYKETTLTLAKGDRLVFYTDGILDVANTSNEVFGRTRLINQIKETKELSPDDATKNILDALQKWSGKNEDETYEDDITLIIFDVLESVNKTDNCRISVKNKPEEIRRIADALELCAKKWQWEDKRIKQLNLAIEEVVSNIIFYAYTDKNEHEITIELVNQSAYTDVIISDDGKPFNLLEAAQEVDINAPAEDRDIGGLGIHILKTLVDHIAYERTENKNILKLTKNTNT